jgi:hypothetical protein
MLSAEECMLPKPMTLYGRLYFGLRFYVHQNRWLLRRLQSLRAYLILGPLRKPMVLFYRKYRTNEPLETEVSDVFSNVDVDLVANRVEELGYSHVGVLPQELVGKLLDYCEVEKRASYWNPHIGCDAIRSIARNFEIVEIARRYLGAEPIFWLTRLRWSFPSYDDTADMQPSLHQEPIEYDPHGFHYDANDFKSITFFVYLTDVDDLDSGAHVVIEGTHKNKALSEIRKKVIDDKFAYKKYNERIKVILGEKGTVFAEESSAYHKVAACKKPRLILMIYYVLARKIPPERLAILPLLGGPVLTAH